MHVTRVHGRLNETVALLDPLDDANLPTSCATSRQCMASEPAKYGQIDPFLDMLDIKGRLAWMQDSIIGSVGLYRGRKRQVPLRFRSSPRRRGPLAPLRA